MWSVPREWDQATAYVVAGGPSVTWQNTELLRGRNVIAVNSSYLRVPFAAFLFFGDKRWWDEHSKPKKPGQPDKLTASGFKGRIVTTCKSTRPEPRRLYVAKVAHTRGLSNDPSAVAFGRTSTHGAINLAFLLGAKRIVLLGVDMCPALDGRSHHHPEHPWPVRPGCWDEQMETMKHLVKPLRERGVEVINTSSVSKVPWWPKRRLEDCLDEGPLPQLPS